MKALLGCFWVASQLMAQTFPAPHLPQWWDGGQVVRLSNDFPRKFELIDASGRRVRALAVPKQATGFWFSNGTAHVYARSARNPKEGVLYQSSGLMQWQHVLRVHSDQSVPDRMFPLEKDRYLAWYGGGYWDGQKASFFATVRLKEDGHIQHVHALDLGFKEPLFVNRPDPRFKRPYQPNPRYDRLVSSLSAGDFEVFPAPEGLIVAHFWTGLFFFVSPSGQLRRTANLYGLSEAELGSFDTEVAVLDAQVLPEGDLILCARTEEAVRLIPKAYQTQGTLDVYRAGRGDELDHRRQEALKAFPELRWFRLDTTQGTFHATTPPRGAPTVIRDLGTFQRFHLNLLPDGRAIVLP